MGQRTASTTAGYVIGAALLVPLVLLGLFFGAYVGSGPLLAASLFTAACALFVWIAKVRTEGRQRAD